jgi:hypothetical protein
VIFFESGDRSKKKAPLSSFKITRKDYEEDFTSALPAWQPALNRALKEAKKKIDCTTMVKSRSDTDHKCKIGAGESGGDRVERRHMESCVWQSFRKRVVDHP